MRSPPRRGDLVIVDPVLDRQGLYLELRDPSHRFMYANPRIVLDPDDVIVVIRVEDRFALILTSSGTQGWIELEALKVLSRFTA